MMERDTTLVRLALSTVIAVGLGSPAAASARALPDLAPEPAPELTAPPEPASAPEPAPEPAPRHRWMRATGIASLASGGGILLLTYTFTALGGAILHDIGSRRVDDPSRGPRGEALIAAGRNFMVPIVGPWFAFPYLTEGGKTGAGFSGAFQGFGLLLALGGVAQLAAYRAINDRPPPRHARRAAPRLTFGGAVTPRYSGATVLLRF